MKQKLLEQVIWAVAFSIHWVHLFNSPGIRNSEFTPDEEARGVADAAVRAYQRLAGVTNGRSV